LRDWISSLKPRIRNFLPSPPSTLLEAGSLQSKN
jgi:hypothetical protein